MKILFITRTLPSFPIGDGSALRLYGLMKEISKSNEISLLSCTNEEVNIPDIILKRCKEIVVVPFPKISDSDVNYHGFFSKLWRLFTEEQGSTVQAKAFSKIIITEFKQRFITKKYDVVWIVQQGAPIGYFLKDFDFNSKVVLEFQIIFQKHYRELAKVMSSLRAKIRRKRLLSELTRLENDTFPDKYDLYISNQQNDAQFFKNKFDKINIFAGISGVDTGYFQFSKEPRKNHEIVILGSMSYSPNTDAAVWAATEILPIIKKTIKDVKLKIVGMDPSPRVQRLNNLTDIEVTGKVPDVRDYMKSCNLFLVPIRVGTGQRIKILQAWAMGCPIVSTTVGAEGNKYIHNENLLIADDVMSIAKESIRIMNDEKLAKKIGRNGYDTALKYYSWKNIAKMHLDSIRSIL